MKDLNSGAAYTQELINLLQEIVVSFSDADSRPNEKIALYEKYRQLQKTHTVKLMGRFIVISGNGEGHVRRARSKTQIRLAQPQRNRQSSATSASKA